MLDGMNSKLEEAEEWINDLEYRVMESNQAEQKREKRIMHSKNRLRGQSDSIKCNNILLIAVPEEEENGVGKEFIWRNNSWKFPLSGERNR